MTTEKWDLRAFIFGCHDLDAEEKKLCYDALNREGLSAANKRRAFFALDEADLRSLGVPRLSTRKVLLAITGRAASAAGLSVESTTGSGSAAGLGAAGAVSGADVASLMRDIARSAAREALDLQTRPRKSKSFSSVNSSDVKTLMSSIKLIHVRGRALAAEDLQLPPGTPECGSFDCSGISGGKNAATPKLLQHHQQQLEKLGITFNQPGGFEMYDTHTDRELLTFSCGEQTYTAGFDGCVSPFGLHEVSAVVQCRIIYEHKLDVKPSKAGHQAVVTLLGAYANGPCPVLLDVTDGQLHNIHTIRNTQLISWEDVSPTQAYFMQARHLKAHASRVAIDHCSSIRSRRRSRPACATCSRP